MKNKKLDFKTDAPIHFETASNKQYSISSISSDLFDSTSLILQKAQDSEKYNGRNTITKMYRIKEEIKVPELPQQLAAKHDHQKIVPAKITPPLCTQAMYDKLAKRLEMAEKQIEKEEQLNASKKRKVVRMEVSEEDEQSEEEKPIKKSKVATKKSIKKTVEDSEEEEEEKKQIKKKKTKHSKEEEKVSTKKKIKLSEDKSVSKKKSKSKVSPVNSDEDE